MHIPYLKERVVMLKNRQTQSLLILVIGILVLIAGGIGYLIASGSGDWSSTKGTVVSSEIKQVRKKKVGNKRSASYKVKIQYKYTIDGIEYESDNYNSGYFGSGGAFKCSSRSVAREAANKKYKPGARVTVYYNPKNPQSAVLKRGTSFNNSYILIAGLMCTGTGVFRLFGISLKGT